MWKSISLLILMFSWCCQLMATPQTIDSNQINITYSTSPSPMPVLNNGNLDHAKERYNSPEFDYTEQNAIEPKESSDLNIPIIGRIINALVSFLLPILLGILVIVGLYQLILYLKNKDSKSLLRNKNETLISTEDIIEDIHEVDFKKHIEEAINNQKYTLAIRWSYLYNLKLMDDKKIIEWKPKKTNKDYYYEISKSTLKKDFKYLTYIYDYLWFGKFEIEHVEAKHLLSKFEDFKSILNKI